MQVKAEWDNHCTHTRMVKMKKNEDTNADKDLEQLELLYSAGRRIKKYYFGESSDKLIK